MPNMIEIDDHNFLLESSNDMQIITLKSRLDYISIRCTWAYRAFRNKALWLLRMVARTVSRGVRTCNVVLGSFLVRSL